jgi:DNA-binding transcriptional regulator YdaS (Cro superfamily)
LTSVLTEEAIRVHGSRKAIAELLEISESAVYQWGEYVPPLSAARLAKRSRGKLKFDPDVYDDWNTKRATH